MSRGHGRVQRAILDYLADDPAGTTDDGHRLGSRIPEVAAAVYGTEEPTGAEIVATRRAVRRLAAEGHVDIRRGDYEPETKRRNTPRPSIIECDGDGCVYCADGLERRVTLDGLDVSGRWVAPEEFGPWWWRVETVERWAAGNGIHAGVIARFRRELIRCMYVSRAEVVAAAANA